MGESTDVRAKRIPLPLPYRVTKLGRRLYEQHGPDGAEATDEVFEFPRSIVFNEAENRLYTVKAVLVAALER
jgi:ornithine carbamoyltransferase